MSILIQRGQLKIGKKTSYGSAFSASTIIGEVFNFSYDTEQNVVERPAVTPYGGGNFKPVKGGKHATFSFEMEMRGTGTPGEAPDFDELLLAAGLTKTTNSGTAAIGSVVSSTRNNGTGAPTVGGTFGHTVSGKLEIEITSITTDASISFQSKFIPAGGGNPTYYSSTQSIDAATTLSGGALDAIEIDFGDPSTDTDNFEVGDTFEVPLTSDQQVDVVYTAADDPASLATAGPALIDIEFIEDGNRYRIGDATVTFTIEGETNGVATITFNGVGIYIAEAGNTSFGTPTINDTAPVIIENAGAFSLGGTTLDCPVSFSFDVGAQSQIRPCATASNGYKGGEIVVHNATAGVTFHADDLATYNHFTAEYANTVQALDITIGTAGNGFKIQSDYASVTDNSQGDREGLRTVEQSYALTNPGDDNPAFKLVFF